MPKDGNKTRVKILDEATQLVYENGFAGTTIDLILERTSITKGAFFYHFKNKRDLAYGLMQHFAQADMNMLTNALKDSQEQASGPRDQLIYFVQHFIDLFLTLESPYPGCLYASYISEPEQFDEEVKATVSESMLVWRKELSKLIEATAAVSQVNTDYQTDMLADMFTVVMEGAFIFSKALNDPKHTANQLIHYRKFLELIFS